MDAREFVREKSGALTTIPVKKIEFEGKKMRLKNVCLTIKDGKIASEQSADTWPHLHATATFGEGHAHIAMNGGGGSSFEEHIRLIKNNLDTAVEIARENFERTVRKGITVLCDLGPAGGDSIPFFLKLREIQKEESGAMIPAQWAYAAWTVVGSPETFAAPFCRIIENERDLRKFFGESVSNGASVVKIIAETELLKEKAFGYDFVFPEKLFYSAAKLARYPYNCISAIHAKGALSVEKGISARANCLEHAIQASASQLKDAEINGIYIGATLEGLRCRLRHAEKTGIGLEEAHYEFGAVTEMVRIASRLHYGFPATNFAASSDAGSEATPHPSLLNEIQLMCEFGFPPHVALASSIVNVRKLMRLPESGSLLPGERADMIFWKQNPLGVLESGESLAPAIAAVMVGGKIVHVNK